jgi:hypothetical protein
MRRSPDREYRHRSSRNRVPDQPAGLPIVFVIVTEHQAGDDTSMPPFGRQEGCVIAIDKRAEPGITASPESTGLS